MEIWNRHHTIFQRRHYKTHLERTFRNHHGLVIPTPVEQHRELHLNLTPPPKPTQEIMLGVLNNLDRPLSGRLDGLFYTIDYLSEIEDKTAQRLAGHLTKQLGYLALGGEYGETQIA